MGALNLIFNFVGLLLWISWRSVKVEAAASATVSLLSTLKKAEGSQGRGWPGLLFLAGLLLVRAVFYRHIGGALSWTPKLELIAIALPFRSDHFGRIFTFSLLSFLIWLGGFYAWMLFLSVLHGKHSDEPFHRAIKQQLGVLERLPGVIKLMLVPMGAALFWVVFSRVFVRFGIMPDPGNGAHLWQQAGVVAIGSCFFFAYLWLAVLIFYLVNSYVYFGNHPFWSYVSASGRRLLWPLKWLPLQVGRVDLRPLAGIGILIALIRGSSPWIIRLYERLPL
ncbi:MAG: hypothetical protein SFY81_14965 [Verrucomicrobiota bacterium]|nr:hypothetical protein [Verrucomicrobiota bacterium]